jgi:hypothetical protein
VATESAILLLRLGFLAALYLFLALLMALLWSEMAARRPAGGRTAPGASLLVVEPGQSGLEEGVALPLDQITSIGREPGNTIVLADPSVSAEHALMTFRQGQWWVEDLASMNGAYVNTIRIERPTIVRPGDVLRFGTVSVRLHV